MAYHLDVSTALSPSLENDNALVIDGFGNGIADSPYDGISDMRNVNIISVPGEASVAFATSKVSNSTYFTGTITSVNSGTDTITFTGGTLETGIAIEFFGTVPAGISTGITYWVNLQSATTFKVWSDYSMTITVDITNTTTGATFTPYRVGVTQANAVGPNYSAFVQDTISVTNGAGADYYMQDSVGQVWSNHKTTTSGLWTFIGLSGTVITSGKGIIFYNSSNLTNRYLFVFTSTSIDYFDLVAYTWVNGWKTGLNNNFHNAYRGQDNVVYFCNGNQIGSFFEKSGQQFDPANPATYTYTQTALLLPSNEIAQCLAELGTNLLVGGKFNAIYPWDRISTSFTYPILLSEFSIQQMVTVNTNTFIFVGNRGRIYITNGSQAQLYKKVPDHLSGTVEPYYTWGGACSNKNQLYFSFSMTNNALTAITTEGGVWAIDLDNKAIRLTNQLSYGTYAGLATGLIPILTGLNPAGAGLYIGWWNGVVATTSYGIDQSASTPYTGSQAYIDSDLIPVGTFLKHRTYEGIEFKLSTPMVSGESVTVQYRLDFSQTYTTIFSDSTAGDFSGYSSVNFENAQWAQFRVILNSTASSPSYTRLRQLRIK